MADIGNFWLTISKLGIENMSFLSILCGYFENAVNRFVKQHIFAAKKPENSVGRSAVEFTFQSV